MKIDKKRLTFFVVSCMIIFLIELQANGKLGLDAVEGFNRDLKNYNAKLQIFDRDSKKIASFKIATARTEEEKMYGLMNLDKLPKDHGMLFFFRETQVVMMWMKNTKIPLDIIFIDADNEIASIAENTKPYSLDLISSQREIKYALEINAGLVKELGIEVRQKVQILN
ncbi:MAG: DUF192 domain-containing protein [Proteobacteria bacterium]|nr:DUF192 domain-containing protein [Pseudomonadota bacterium]